MFPASSLWLFSGEIGLPHIQQNRVGGTVLLGGCIGVSLAAA